MIFFKKSDGTELQKLLDKRDPNIYRSDPVLAQLIADFHGKCYLCEDAEPQPEIEHFEPHKGNLAMQFDWNNLFYACRHCNSIKGAHFWPLLNCTNPADKVWDSIEIVVSEFPKTKVEIKLTSECPRQTEGENTQRLLEKALTGKGATPMQKNFAGTLRQKMLREFEKLSKAVQDGDTAAIHAAISDKAPFAGMLRWRLKTEFPTLLNSLIEPQLISL